jgi:hypothetical protein
MQFHAYLEAPSFISYINSRLLYCQYQYLFYF